jgi:ABC-type lipoprotein release transport system permease subunit
MQKWQWMNQIDNTLAGYVGYIQITDTAYVEEKTMDNAFQIDKVDIEKIKSVKGVKGVYPRIQSGVLGSIGIRSKSAGVLGITPSIDSDEMNLPEKLLEGELIEDGDKSILITDQMAKFYQVKSGDSLILFGMGYQGFTAAGIYHIKGIIRIPAGDMSNMVYMSMKEAQYFYAAEGLATALLIDIEEGANLYKVQEGVKAEISDLSLVVRNWEEVLPAMKSGMELDEASNQLIAGVLLVVVCFGIFGTIVMMYSERIFEFGILLSIGMKKGSILLITLLEVYLLMLIGVFAGCLLVTPLLLWMKNSPIPLSGDAAETMIEYGIDPVISVGTYPEIYLSSSMTIIILTILMSGYVIFKIIKLNPLDAMKKH